MRETLSASFLLRIMMMLGFSDFSQTQVFGVLGFLVLLTCYCALSRRSHARATLTTQSFGLPDALCAGILTLWMISNIAQGMGKHETISLSAIIMSSIFYGILVLGIFGVIRFQRQSAIDFFQLQPSRFPKAALTGILWLLICYPLILATQSVVQQFIGGGDDSQEIVRYFLDHPDFKSRAAVILMAVIVAPMAEEIIFRGYFYGVIRRYGGRFSAVLTSSLLFAAIHDHLPSFPGLFVLAMILCLLYERTGSLWANICFHSAFNTSTLIFLLLWPDFAK